MSRKNTRKCFACSNRHFSSLPRLDWLFFQQIVHKQPIHNACGNRYDAPPTSSQLLRRNQFASKCENAEAIKSLSNRFTTKPISNRFKRWCVNRATSLDTTICLREDNLIGTNLYVKPTDKHQYLRMDSCHPKHCKASIPFSQAQRLRQFCSENRPYMYIQRTHELKQHFLSRG